MLRRPSPDAPRTSSTDAVDSYRTRTAPIWGWLGIAGGVLIAGLGATAGGTGSVAVPVLIGGAVAMLAVALFMRPIVIVNEHAIVVHNITQVVTVPFARLKDLHTRWGLELVMDDASKVGAFAAPDPHRRDRRKAPSEQMAADLVAMIRGAEEQWLEGPHRAADQAAWAGRAPLERRWDPVGLALVCGALAAVLAGFFLA
ncbi:hypothetical protein [Demequina globuliformis]|uniref:hypothetical protein n=1 Tax=Demequina globuliformis TaxID=676202 RepID=UPI0007849F3A|nr:hypothetical protein [Demequina globuliformis]